MKRQTDYDLLLLAGGALALAAVAAFWHVWDVATAGLPHRG